MIIRVNNRGMQECSLKLNSSFDIPDTEYIQNQAAQKKEVIVFSDSFYAARTAAYSSSDSSTTVK